MDIFIIGAQGSGKTATAHEFLTKHFGAKNWYEIPPRQLLVLGSLPAVRVDVIRETVREARVEAVLFDGCFTSDEDLVIAVQAVKEARVQTGRNLLAIYCKQSNPLREVAALTIAQVETPAPVTNEFRS